MWYVMQVRTGKEEKTILIIQKHTADIAAVCFLPKFERSKRYGGSWHKEQAVLFPGYVFVDTEEIERFYLGLKNVPELTKVLGNGELWTPIQEEELKLLRHLLKQDYLMDLSEGIIVHGQVVIEKGPLKGMEAVIKKIDRHKRVARVELQMFGRYQEIEVGLEILRKE